MFKRNYNNYNDNYGSVSIKYNGFLIYKSIIKATLQAPPYQNWRCTSDRCWANGYSSRPHAYVYIKKGFWQKPPETKIIGHVEIQLSDPFLPQHQPLGEFVPPLYRKSARHELTSWGAYNIDYTQSEPMIRQEVCLRLP